MHTVSSCLPRYRQDAYSSDGFVYGGDREKRQTRQLLGHVQSVLEQKRLGRGEIGWSQVQIHIYISQRDAIHHNPLFTAPQPSFWGMLLATFLCNVPRNSSNGFCVGPYGTIP